MIQVQIEKLNGKVLLLKVPKGEIVKAKYFCIELITSQGIDTTSQEVLQPKSPLNPKAIE